MSEQGTLFVISSPSGGGKTSICRKLREEMPELSYSISTTTRPKREGEENGKDYFFVSEAEFKEKIEKKEFSEWALVHGHYYGTPRQFLEQALRSGKKALLDIDVQGALKIKKEFSNACLIFIAPPTLEILRERLRQRKTDNEAEISRRMKIAKQEMSCAKEYHHVVTNKTLSQAVREVKALITFLKE